MRWIGRVVVPAFAALVVGCGKDPSVPTDVSTLHRPVFYVLGESTTCGGTGVNNENYSGVDRNCLIGGDIVLTPGGAQYFVLEGLIGSWNAWLDDLPGMPTFTIGANGVPVTIPGTSGAYCGETTVGDSGRVGEVIIYADAGNACNEKKTGSLSAVILHELAHVLGWNKSHGGASARTEITADCVTFVPAKEAEVEMSTTVCQHDVEALFRAFLNEDGWTHSGAYFTSPILWTTNAPAHDSIPVSSIDTIPMTQWLPLTGSGVNRSPSSLNWSSPSELFTSIGSSTGQVTTGGSTGTGNVYLKATSSPPSGYITWSPFKEVGDSVTVTVIPAGPFLIDSVTASGMDTLPYLTGGERVFTAWVRNAPVGTLGTVWRFIVPGVSADTVGAVGNAELWEVPSGEYGLEVQVRAYVGSTWSGSGYTTVYFPVCVIESFAECPSP